MWNDWSCDVRKAAAHALSKLDMSTDLQNELRLLPQQMSLTYMQMLFNLLFGIYLVHNKLFFHSVKLEEGPNGLRLEALIFIGQLNIMTPKLLHGFLQCFSDDSVAVRTQACLTAASLMIKDQEVSI